MDAIVEHISSLEHPADIRSFGDKLAYQQHYLQSIKNQPTKYAYILSAIHQIDDENTLTMLIQQCDEYERKCKEAIHFKMVMSNIEFVKNAYKLPDNRNVRPFYEREMDLLDTLHKISMLIVGYDNGEPIYNIVFDLNNMYYAVQLDIETAIQKIETQPYDNHTTYVLLDYKNFIRSIVLNECNPCAWNTDLLNTLAFSAKITANEFKDFVMNLILSINVQRNEGFYYDSKIHYNPTMNIADLLLCAIHEQYPENITLQEMNLADRVFYDEFLLKCITSVKFL